ncbi:MAG: sodium/proton-translocating pyrophosphatase, partial [Anaerolineales bacterium]|nr:sodium/proton-translocating pyrophosphatase [Anaerolineales bacterium]
MMTFLAEVAAQSGDSVPLVWWLGPIGSVVALIFAFIFYQAMMKESEGNKTMIEIAQAVREGAMAYLRAQYRVVLIVFATLFVVFLILAMIGAQDWFVPFAFLTAGFFSGVAGYVGMRTATNASARTAQAASESLNGGLRVAFRGGAVMGLGVVGFALLDMSIWFLILYFVSGESVPQITSIMLSAAAGASTMALFGRVGGGIYTKAADVGADLVGKVEAGIPEDDPRNPATIADNVGDNVGDVAGMGADLYESYVASILSAVALGVAGIASGSVSQQLQYVALPVSLAGIGVLMSILGVFLVRAPENATMKSLIFTLERSIWIAAALIAAIMFGVLQIVDLANHTATA